MSNVSFPTAGMNSDLQVGELVHTVIAGGKKLSAKQYKVISAPVNGFVEIGSLQSDKTYRMETNEVRRVEDDAAQISAAVAQAEAEVAAPNFTGIDAAAAEVAEELVADSEIQTEEDTVNVNTTTDAEIEAEEQEIRNELALTTYKGVSARFFDHFVATAAGNFSKESIQEIQRGPRTVRVELTDDTKAQLVTAAKELQTDDKALAASAASVIRVLEG